MTMSNTRIPLQRQVDQSEAPRLLLRLRRRRSRNINIGRVMIKVGAQRSA